MTAEKSPSRPTWSMATLRKAMPAPTRLFPTRMLALKMALCYALLGALWIFYSGWLLHHLVHDAALEALLENVKGWFYVAATAALLWLGLNHYFREIRRSAEQIQEDEKRFRSLLEKAPEGIFVQSNRQILFLNPAMLGILGAKDVEDLPSSDIMSYIATEYHEAVQARIQTQCESEKPSPPMEQEYLRLDGSRVAVETTAVLVRYQDRDAHLVFVRNITERKRAEAALRDSEARFNRLAEQCDTYTWEVDAQGLYTQVSPVSEAVLGYRPEEMVGCMHFYDLHADSEREAFKEAALAVFSKKKPFLHLESAAQGKDGRLVWVSTDGLPILNTDGTLRGYWGTDTNITERKRAEAALRDSEENFRLLVENAPQGIFVQTDHRFAYLNAGALRLFGATSSEQMLGLSVMDRFHPSLNEAVRARIHALNVERKEAALIEQIYLRLDGSEVPVEVAAVPIVFEGKSGALVFVRDITERKQAEKEKATLEAQIQQAQKMESVGRLAGGVAHDFNNMLGVILGHVELALAQVGPAGQLHDDLEEIRTAAIRSADLTRQLLAFARKQIVAPQVLDLNKTVSGMLKMLQRLIGENIDIDWQPGEDLWTVNMDPSQIDQILANLCVNARDAIADVGRISIETKNCTFDEEYCSDHPGFAPGEYVRLVVSDNGCGMAPETLAHIFEPFFTTKGVGEGTGLGLATVYGAVRQNNGFINAWSKPGCGTTFTAYLPRYAGKAEPMRTDGAAKPYTPGCETILLVEDDPSMLKLSRMLLERQGYTVLSASTPGDAIRLAQEYLGELHLLMTDMIMPGMNGRDLAKNLQPLYPNIQCLFMSGYTADIIAPQGVLDKGVHFIQKPFSTQKLAATIREVLDGE